MQQRPRCPSSCGRYPQCERYATGFSELTCFAPKVPSDCRSGFSEMRPALESTWRHFPLTGTIEICSRDQFLSRGRQGCQDVVAALRVKCPENVIDKIERRTRRELSKPARLSELHGKGNRALLTFRGKERGRASIQRDGNIILMRADNCRLQPDFLFAARAQRIGEVEELPA